MNPKTIVVVVGILLMAVGMAGANMPRLRGIILARVLSLESAYVY